jgi:hypothetical protein
MDSKEVLIQKLKDKITAYEMAMMDAPYFGIPKEFINGYSEAMRKIKEEILKIENE